MTHHGGEDWADVIITNTWMRFSFWDRLRILIGLKARLRTTIFVDQKISRHLTIDDLKVDRLHVKKPPTGTGYMEAKVDEG